MAQFLLALIMLAPLLVMGQSAGNHISDHDKSKYFKFVYQACESADILDLESKGDYIEIEYLCNGQYFEMGISQNQVIFIEQEVDAADIPMDVIRRKLAKKHQGWLLDEVSVVTTSDTSFLKVEVIKDGLEQNLFFTTDGKWYKAKSIVVSDKWTIENLEESSLFKSAPYSFLAPEETYTMPEILREISGVVLAPEENSVFCVQDELGAVFEYDFEKDLIVNTHRFTDVGDFEDIARKQEKLYVLRSDGNVFHFNYQKKYNIEQFMVAGNALNYESLTYHAATNQFLLVSKDAELSAPEWKRTVYQFAENQPNTSTVYLEIDAREISKLLASHLTNMESNDVLFNPSAIAVHPQTNDVYILSASDRIVTIYASKQLKAVYPLPANVYYKPEGLAFFKNGDLFISSEGDKRGLIPASIMRLKYR